MLLTDEELTYLARRDRAAVGPTLDRWSPDLTDSGVYIGTALRAIASQREHQRGITEFAACLAGEVARSEEHELLDLLPTQRSQISYYGHGSQHVLLPDASFPLAYRGNWQWCLLEYERRATTPRRLPARLRSYRDYFESGYALRDHGGKPPLVLFVFESEQACPSHVTFCRTRKPSLCRAAHPPCRVDRMAPRCPFHCPCQAP